MKKFLFTLAALLMAGTAFAWEQAGGSNPTGDYVYAEDVELTEDQATNGASIIVPLNMHLDHYISAYRILMDYPEGVECIDGVESGESAEMEYVTRTGATRYFTPTIAANPENTVFLMQHMQQTFENGVALGVAHYAPGDYMEMLYLFLEIPAGFQGGTLTMTFEPASGKYEGWDDSFFVRNAQQITSFQISVPAARQPQPLPGQIVFGEVDAETGLLPVSYNGEETVTLTATLNGEAVEIVDGNIQLVDGNNAVVVTATADGYEAITGTFEGTWTAPVVPQDLTGTVTFTGPTEEGIITFIYTGEEAVTIKVDGEVYNGEPIQLVPGDNQFEVTVEADGYNTLEMSFDIEWTITPPVPEVTATPNIVVTEGDEFYTITVEGNGELHMYVNNTEVEFPYIINRDVVDVTYTITATAQEDGKLISETATRVVTVPAIEDVPEDPHMTGYWLAIINIHGGIDWFELQQGANGDYITSVDLYFEQYGTYNPLNEDERPNVPFYFVVNGVVYGAGENMQIAVDGDAMQNPLYADSENYYSVPVGFNYALGIAIPSDGNFYVYVSRAYPSGIDELVNGKQIAGVRYFNMAGQEMQEANGVTIVVTTYTDGTTSTAKVMK